MDKEVDIHRTLWSWQWWRYTQGIMSLPLSELGNNSSPKGTYKAVELGLQFRNLFPQLGDVVQ